ncbi:hypothetical protein ABFS83_14G099700 [Erythranthe nasuta]
MPRVGGGAGRGFGGKCSRSVVPQPVHQTQPPAPRLPRFGGYTFGSFGATLVGVMIWCGGAVFAMRVVDSLWGPRTIKVQSAGYEKTKPPSAKSNGDPCGAQLKAFQDCLKSCSGEISKCQVYTDMLRECKKNSGSVMTS